MRILINALSAQNGGGQTYIINLLNNKTDIKDQVFILTQPSFDLKNLPSHIIQIRLKLNNPFMRIICEELLLIYFMRKLNINVYFSPACILPFFLLPNIKTVVTFQNMLPFDCIQRKKYPIFGYRSLRDYLLKKLFSRSMLRADLVIFLSEFARNKVRKELSGFNGLNIVIPHGVDDIFKHKSEVNKKLSFLLRKPYFTYVSYIDYYKGHIEMVEGFKTYCANGGEGILYFVGHEYKPYARLLRKKITILGLFNRVKFLGVIDHYMLPFIYQNAFINLFGSYVENCPNILLEIMSSGRPALISNKEPMPEIAKSSVFYFDPTDPMDFSDKLTLLAQNKKLQKKLSAEAQVVVGKYSWTKTAQVTWSSISKLVSEIV